MVRFYPCGHKKTGMVQKHHARVFKAHIVFRKSRAYKTKPCRQGFPAARKSALTEPTNRHFLYRYLFSVY